MRLKPPTRDVRKYGFSLVAVLVPAGMQFVLFAFYARALGPEQYGLYIALMSWSPLCFELVGWGAGEYLVQRTARHPADFAAARSHLTTMFWLTLPVGALIFAVLTFAVMSHSVSLWTIAIIGLAEFAGLRLLVNAEQMAIGLQRMHTANWLRLLLVAPRMAGVAIAYFGLGLQTFDMLALAGSIGLLAAGVASALWAHRHLPAASGERLSRTGLRNGTWFTGNQLVRASQHNIDRIVLTPLVDPTTLALYSAAQRFVQLGLLPIQAVLRLTYRGFFEAGKSGIRASVRYGLTVLPLALGAAAATALCLFAAASFLPLLIGTEFTQSVSYLLYLTPSLVLFALNSTVSDTLSGAGFLSLRLLLTTAGVVTQALMFWLLHDGTQIVLANYAGIGLSCLLTIGATFILWRRDHRTAATVPGPA